MVLGIAVLFTSNFTSARLFSNYKNSCYPANLSNTFNITSSFSNLGFTGDLVNLYWYKDPSTATNKNNLMYYNSNTGNYSNDVNLYSYNMGDLYNCSIPYYPWGTSAGYVVINTKYNFINVEKTSGNLGTDYTFWIWSDNSKSYRKITTPWGGYSTTVNGETVMFDEWFPRHGSIVFYSSETKHTIQFIGSKSILDYIVYFDPSEDGQNLYVINNYLGKAWSLSDNNNDPRYYLFGLWDSDIDTLLGNLKNNFEYSYSLTGGGAFFFPATNGQKGLKISWDSHWINTNATEIPALGRTISYLSDVELDLSGLPDSPSNSGSGSVSTGSAYDSYVACRDTYTNIKNWANSEYLCRQDMSNGLISSGYFENLFHLIYNFTSNTTGGSLENVVASTTNCQNWVDYSVMAYYSSDLGNENLSNYQDKFLIADRNSWSLNMLDVSNYCTYDITSNVGGSEDSDCRQCAWGLLGDALCSKVCNVVHDGNNMSVHDYIEKSVASWATGAISLPYDRLMVSFRSGYNFMGDNYGSSICSSDYYGKSYGFVDLGIYILLISIFLFGILHL